MFNTELRRISGVLAAALLVWIAGQVMMITPLATAVDRLTHSIDSANGKNSEEHNLIIDRLENADDKIAKHKTRMDKNEVKLFRVVEDCQENHSDIKECKRVHR